MNLNRNTLRALYIGRRQANTWQNKVEKKTSFKGTKSTEEKNILKRVGDLVPDQ